MQKCVLIVAIYEYKICVEVGGECMYVYIVAQNKNFLLSFVSIKFLTGPYFLDALTIEITTKELHFVCARISALVYYDCTICPAWYSKTEKSGRLFLLKDKPSNRSVY